MKIPVVKSSPLPVLIPLGPKYSPQDPVFKYPWPVSLLRSLLLQITPTGCILATCPAHLYLLD